MRPDIREKIDAVTKIGPERMAAGGWQPPPKSVKIAITTRCPLKCKYCATQIHGDMQGRDMDLEFFKAITEDMRYCAVEEIGVFYLGESFAAPKLLRECVKWVKKELGFTWVFLTSNALLATPSAVEDVILNGLDSLKWSVNAADPKQYAEVTGGTEEQFWKSMENIANAWEIRNRLAAKTIISASSIYYDEEQPKRMKPLLDQYVLPFVDRHYWLPMYTMAMVKKKLEQETGFIPTVGNSGRIDELTWKPNRQPIPCWAVFTEGHVRVDGGLSACCFGYDSSMDMGKLNGTNFMREWNSYGFRKLRMAHLDYIGYNTGTRNSYSLKGTICERCME